LATLVGALIHNGAALPADISITFGVSRSALQVSRNLTSLSLVQNGLAPSHPRLVHFGDHLPQGRASI
jgi:hypothetical protein